MPPTPWQTEILVPGTWAGVDPRIWQCGRAANGMCVGEAAIGVAAVWPPRTVLITFRLPSPPL